MSESASFLGHDLYLQCKDDRGHHAGWLRLAALRVAGGGEGGGASLMGQVNALGASHHCDVLFTADDAHVIDNRAPVVTLSQFEQEGFADVKSDQLVIVVQGDGVRIVPNSAVGSSAWIVRWRLQKFLKNSDIIEQ